MVTRLAASRHAVVPLGGLAVLVLLPPATPSGNHTADLVIASALLAVGSVGWFLTLRWRGGWAVATAGALIVHAAIDRANDPSAVRWLATAAGPLVVAFAAITIGGRKRYWWMALAGGIVAGPLRMLVYDPFLDPSCDGCRHSPVVLAHHPAVARSFFTVGSLLMAAALATIAVRLARSWPLLVAAVVVGASIWRPETGVAAAAIALGVISSQLIRTTTSRRRVSHLVRVFRDDVHLEQTLRMAISDPTLTVAYWLDAEDRFAARTDGTASDPADGQVVTELRIGDKLVAAIYHNREVSAVIALADALDGPARIALDNEYLAAQVASQSRELQRSRMRIIERSDLERQQLERDVHDGAQQHVLALGFGLRTELTRMSGEDPRRPVIERCLAETSRALDDLRELSHGLYPPSLQAGGLVPALHALSGRSPVDVTICTVPAHRLPTPIERAVFVLVADAAGTAEHALDVDITTSDTTVTVHMIGMGAPPGQHVVDRIAALDGSIVAYGSTIEAVIPCEL